MQQAGFQEIFLNACHVAFMHYELTLSQYHKKKHEMHGLVCETDIKQSKTKQKGSSQTIRTAVSQSQVHCYQLCGRKQVT